MIIVSAAFFSGFERLVIDQIGLHLHSKNLLCKVKSDYKSDHGFNTAKLKVRPWYDKDYHLFFQDLSQRESQHTVKNAKFLHWFRTGGCQFSYVFSTKSKSVCESQLLFHSGVQSTLRIQLYAAKSAIIVYAERRIWANELTMIALVPCQ